MPSTTGSCSSTSSGTGSNASSAADSTANSTITGHEGITVELLVVKMRKYNDSVDYKSSVAAIPAGKYVQWIRI